MKDKPRFYLLDLNNYTSEFLQEIIVWQDERIKELEKSEVIKIVYHRPKCKCGGTLYPTKKPFRDKSGEGKYYECDKCNEKIGIIEKMFCSLKKSNGA